MPAARADAAARQIAGACFQSLEMAAQQSLAGTQIRTTEIGSAAVFLVRKITTCTRQRMMAAVNVVGGAHRGAAQL